MIIFKCDKCGYTSEISADQMNCETSDYDKDRVYYCIRVIKPERTFKDFKSIDHTWLLCDECHKNWATVVQDAIHQAALEYIEGGKDNG